MRTRRIRAIGIHAHVANPKAWDINGGVVTLRVEPAAEAQVLASSVAAAERTPRETAKAAPRRPQTESTKAPDSQPHPEAVQTAEPTSRVKSPSAPVFGTKRMGAW
jgi:septal ring-binding cell division protein DamX